MPSDIFIIPNRNSTTAAPVMQFSGSQGSSIRLEVLTSGSVAFLGKSGSLFSISDNFSGSLMAVGDISGLPILEVFSDDRVVMGRFNSNTLVVTGSSVGIGKSNPNPAARLDVSGSVFISGSTSISGSLSVSVPSGTAATFSTPGGGFVSFTNGLIDSNSSQFGFKAGAGVAAYIGANNNQHLTINTSGNVGIGKTTPGVPLDVNGNAIITGSLTITGGITGSSGLGLFAGGTNTNVTLTPNGSGYVNVVQSTSTTATNNYALTVGIASTSNVVSLGNHTDYAWFQSFNSRPLSINPLGNNIGIAKTTPSVTLDVNGNTFITGSLSVAANTNQSITLYANGTGLVSVGNMSGAGTRTRLEIAQVGIRLFYIENTATTGQLAFGDGSGETFRMIGQGINTLLFGTTTNSNNGRLQLASHTTTGSGIGFGTDTALHRNAAGSLVIDNVGGSAPGLSLSANASVQSRFFSNGSNTFLESYTSTPLILRTNQTTALTLDTSQNATLSGNYFYVGGAGNFYVRATGANNGLIRANIFSTDLDGDFRVRNAAGTQNYLTVDSQKALFSGSVGISKATTSATLDVNGNAMITGSLFVTGSISDFIGNVRDIPQNLQTSGYTLVASDNGKHIFTTASITVPASVFVTGDVVTVINSGSATLSITQGSSVLLRQAGTTNTGSRTLASYGIASITCVASNTFYVTGTGLV